MGNSVAHVAITPDGARALAIKPLANSFALLEIDGQKVTYNNYDMLTGLFPYNVDITPDGKLAVVANNGDGGNPDGNVDTAAVIDIEADPPRVIDHVVVGDAPEGFAISPTGDFAVAILLRATADKKAFSYNKNSCVVRFKIDGKTMTKTNEVDVGGVAEGVGFSPNGKYLYAANYLDSDISILRVEDAHLVDTGKRVALPGRPAALRMVAVEYQNELTGIVGLESAAFAEWRDNDFLNHPAVNASELTPSYTLGLFSPEESCRENWWYYSQSGPGDYKGNVYYYCVDMGTRDEIKIANMNLYKVSLLSGQYDDSATPEMTKAAADSIAGARSVLMRGIGHFQTIENYPVFRPYLLEKLEYMKQGSPDCSLTASSRTQTHMTGCLIAGKVDADHERLDSHIRPTFNERE